MANTLYHPLEFLLNRPFYIPKYDNEEIKEEYANHIFDHAIRSTSASNRELFTRIYNSYIDGILPSTFIMHCNEFCEQNFQHHLGESCYVYNMGILCTMSSDFVLNDIIYNFGYAAMNEKTPDFIRYI
jgi:hypothetical protein